MPKMKNVLINILLLLTFPSAGFAGTLIGDYNIVPGALPTGFEPWAGTKSPSGTYIVAGSFNDQAAYIEINRGPDGGASLSEVRLLPSLDAATGGSKLSGRVRDVYVNARGELEFVGSSKTPNLNPDPGAGEATVWNSLGQPTALGFLSGAIQSQALSGSRNGLYVGESRGDPILFSATAGPIRLPGGDFGTGVAISKDGSTIVGGVDTGLAYWTANVVGSDYTQRSVALPDGGFDAGTIYGVENDWLVGVYFSETLLDYAGAIWSVSDGSLILDFAREGAVGNALVETVDGYHVAGFNTVEGGQGPFLYIEGDLNITPVASLFHDLAPELGAISQLVDIFPGTLSVLALTTTGQYVFASFQTNGTNIPPEPVPEPASLALVGAALIGRHLVRRRPLAKASHCTSR